MSRLWEMWLSVTIVGALATLTRGQGYHADLTDYDSISFDLRRHWASSLPPLPQVAMDTSDWSGVNSTKPFQLVRADLADAPHFCSNQSSTALRWPAGSMAAGPLYNCSYGACTSGINDSSCKASTTLNGVTGIASLNSKHGTHWAHQSAQPAWVQMHFPTPVSSAQVTFRFTMDARYPPGMRGGNPCAGAASNSSYNCSLCTSELNGGPWDYTVPAGAFLLWARPNASRHVISGPIDVRSLYDAGKTTVVVDSPVALNLTGHSEVTVTLLAFNQYPHLGELQDGVSGYTISNPSRCSVAWTRSSSEPSGANILMAVTSAEIVTRSAWSPVTEPAVARPRMFGANPSWRRRFVQPFEDAACVSTSPVSPGWGGDGGMVDFKTAWTSNTMGYAECHTSGNLRFPPASIQDKVRTSYGDPSFRSFGSTNEWSAGLSAMHLVRRMRACHQQQAAASCQFNASETQWLADTIVRSELAWFDPASRVRSSTSWGWEQDSDGCCGFDLFTAVPMKFFSIFVDTLSADVAAINSTALGPIATKMRWYINDFVAKFQSGHWSLWNGNNWTPVLTEAATYWVIALWHEEGTLPRTVMHIVTDINILHGPMITTDGVYKEGVCQYSYMSVRSTLAIAVLYAQSFGAAWPTLNTTAIASLGMWQMDSHDSGYAVDFGDSHSCRGTVPETLYALMASALAQPDLVAAAAAMQVDGCVVRMWATMAYFVTVRDPWNFWPVVVARNWSADVAQCPGADLRGATPLGPPRSVVYPGGGYGMMRSPLLAACAGSDVDRWQCSNSTQLPKLLDVGVYSQLSVQARPNAFPHSEVDFGTFKWTAFGSSLISEFGYGTIATAVNRRDSRRLINLDNSPTGHNTLVIREALTTGTSPVDFSQFQWEQGTIEATSFAGLTCQHLDGSQVYGSNKTNGWLQYMHRWFCTVAQGQYLLVEALAVKAARGRLSVYGAEYNGPNFAETVAASYDLLTIDDYFYTPHWLSGTEITNSTNTTFDRSSAGRWCSHTDVERAPGSGDRAVLIQTDCAFLDRVAESNITGRVSSWSEHGGQLTLDGVISAPNQWGTLNMHKNRFRYVSANQTSSGGDVRAFLMTAAQGPPAATWVESYGAPTPSAVHIAACVDSLLVAIVLQRDSTTAAMQSATSTQLPCDGAVPGSGLDALEPTGVPTHTPTQPPTDSPVTPSPTLLGASPSSAPTGVGQLDQAESSKDPLSTTTVMATSVAVVLVALVGGAAVAIVWKRNAHQPPAKTAPHIVNPCSSQTRGNVYVPPLPVAETGL